MYTNCKRPNCYEYPASNINTKIRSLFRNGEICIHSGNGVFITVDTNLDDLECIIKSLIKSHAKEFPIKKPQTYTIVKRAMEIYTGVPYTLKNKTSSHLLGSTESNITVMIASEVAKYYNMNDKTVKIINLERKRQQRDKAFYNDVRKTYDY